MTSPKKTQAPASSFFASQITGTGSAFPATRVTNNDLSWKINTTHEWILDRTGIKERRISRAGEMSERNSSLAYKASLSALEMAGKKPEDLDQILYATCTPDTLIPNTGCWLQKKLGPSLGTGFECNLFRICVCSCHSRPIHSNG